MDSQHTAFDNEQLYRLRRTQQNYIKNRDHQSQLSENEFGKTVIDKRNKSVASINVIEYQAHVKTKSPQGAIAVASFAKMKLDPEEHFTNKEQSQSQVEPALERECLPYEFAINQLIGSDGLQEILNCQVIPNKESNVQELNPKSLNIDAAPYTSSSRAETNLHIKQEILFSHGTYYANAVCTSEKYTTTNKFSANKKAEALEPITFSNHRDSNENSTVSPLEIPKVKNELQVPKIDDFSNDHHHNGEYRKSKFFINPLAFIKKSQNLKKFSTDSFLDEKLREICEETYLKNNFDVDSNLPLYVNTDTQSNTGAVFNEVQSVQVIPDNQQDSTSMSLNKINESSTYYNIIDISSEENEKTPATLIPDSLGKNKMVKKRKPYKTRQNQRTPKLQSSHKKLNKRICKTAKKARKRKNGKSSKSTSGRDFAFKIKSLKNLPKTTIKTRANKTNKEQLTQISPKPFKIKITVQKDHSIATVLPKPIMVKCESECIDVRNTQLYQKPVFQPRVHLKRLKSEELLTPLRTKKIRKCLQECRCHRAKHHDDDNDKSNLSINRAFNLNPHFKLICEHSYNNSNYNQPLLFSSITTPRSISNDNIKDQLNDTESKYFTQPELSSGFHSTSPERDSVLSINIDSGVSTSTFTTIHRHTNNRSLLLEIAAERAFINNHLKEFGYSPIQFHLYNDFNELKVFLKYLIDQTNIN